eukprot:Blabericola_migrator_1__8090@NODE_4165_length_1299_cov_328_360390_g510_i3_p2_GENE_NODE_4165_length_1299_cov_328_360390_g510_i3NODE_4165_length_1299_cov_328_360390_g510_i3_p2_ORF_typecomplete_len146_score24_42Acylphosphatase/PF00708_18/0_22_NODE_4165_length_1299_cov_328_360390_g510_i36581095
MTDKALLATPPTAATTKLSDKKQLRQPGAVKITLHSANNTVDEKAEVRVALNNPEDAVEKMLQTLAQRFPPESVMTIAPVKGTVSSCYVCDAIRDVCRCMLPLGSLSIWKLSSCVSPLEDRADGIPLTRLIKRSNSLDTPRPLNP